MSDLQEVTVEPREAAPENASFKHKIQRAASRSDSKAGSIVAVLSLVFCGTIAVVIYVALGIALPLAEIILGSMFLKDCDAERYIPIYLIVAGCFGFVAAVLKGGTKARENQQDEESSRGGCCANLISLFIFAWFIAGSYWIYHIYGDYQSDDKDADKYCHHGFYLAAFWIQTGQYILMGVVLVLGIILCCCACCCAVLTES